MSNAQGWTLIGAFVALFGVLITLVLRVVQTEIGALRREITLRFDTLERDVQRLFVHAFDREEPPAP